jgi:hypothetical protein
MTKRLTPRDYETLSAYLDGELPARERVKLEARLSQQPELRAGLEDLRQTSLLLHNLPLTKAPRNFTILPQAVRQLRTPRAYPVLRLASALAAILFVVAFAGDLALGQAPKSLPTLLNAPAAAPTIAQTPSILTFGSSQSNSNVQPPAAPRAIAPGLSTDTTPASPVVNPPTFVPQPTQEPSSDTYGTAENQAATSAPAAIDNPPSETPGGIAAMGISPFNPETTQPALGAGAAATSTPPPPPTATEPPLLSTEIQPPTVGPRTSIAIPSTPEEQTRHGTAVEPTIAEPPQPGLGPLVNKSSPPTEGVSGAAPLNDTGEATPPGFAATYPNLPGSNPILEYVRPALHASEFFLAGIALLAGLAAIILKLTARP